MKSLFLLLSTVVKASSDSVRALYFGVVNPRSVKALADLCGEVSREFNSSEMPQALAEFRQLIENDIPELKKKASSAFFEDLAVHAEDVAKAAEILSQVFPKPAEPAPEETPPAAPAATPPAAPAKKNGKKPIFGAALNKARGWTPGPASR